MGGINLLAAITSFLAFVLLSYGIMMAYESRRKMRKRMEEPVAPKAAVAVLRNEEAGHPFFKPLFNWLTFSGQWAFKDQSDSKVQALLIHGGFRKPNAPAIFYGLKVVASLVLPVPFLLFAIMHDKPMGMSLLISFCLAGVGYMLPQFVLQKIVNRRQEKLDKALPDVIDLFVICMEAGLSLQATVNRVAEEIRPVCPEFYSELQITGGEMRTGIARDAALSNLGQRTGVQSIQSLVTLMNQSDKMGASIAQSLRVHADFVRTQRTLRAEEKAAKLPVKIMIPMVFFIFPALFIVILGPAVIRIAEQLFPAMIGH